MTKTTIALLMLLLTGCAHQRLMDAGNDHLVQGQYQLAIEKYEAALKREPNDNEARSKLAQARAGFNQWLAQLAIAAEKAERDGHLAKAELLFAKLSAHQNDTNTYNKVLQLRQKNLSRHGLSLYLDIKQPQIEQNLSHRFTQVDFLMKRPSQQMLTNANRVLTINLEPMLIDLHKEQVERSEQYVSHQENIVNPDYESLQLQVSDLRLDIKDLNFELDDQKQRAYLESKDLSLLEKDLEISLLKLERLDPNSSQYQPLIRNISKLRTSITSKREELNRTEKKIERSERKIRKFNDELDSLFYAMDDTPQLALVDVMADYVYLVTITKQIAKASLSVASATGNRNYIISSEYQDESHDAHDAIGIEQNPLVLKKRSELQQRLYTQARLKVATLVEQEIEDYQQYLLSQAHRQNSLADQLNMQLMAIVVGQKSLPRQEQRNIELALKNEFGLGGVFNLDTLLIR